MREPCQAIDSDLQAPHHLLEMKPIKLSCYDHFATCHYFRCEVYVAHLGVRFGETAKYMALVSQGCKYQRLTF